MPSSFNMAPGNPRTFIRLGLGVLAAANLVAGYFVFRPMGGSAQDLSEQATQMRAQIQQQQTTLNRTRLLVEKVQSGRAEGDQFMGRYFLSRRAAFSTIMAELNDSASQSKIAPRESAFSIEPVDGSDTLEMMQITANYEGAYPDLIHFVNMLDKSDRLLVIESLNATPQQTGGKLNILLKLDTFVKEDGSAVKEEASGQ